MMNISKRSKHWAQWLQLYACLQISQRLLMEIDMLWQWLDFVKVFYFSCYYKPKWTSYCGLNWVAQLLWNISLPAMKLFNTQLRSFCYIVIMSVSLACLPRLCEPIPHSRNCNQSMLSDRGHALPQKSISVNCAQMCVCRKALLMHWRLTKVFLREKYTYD